jgi:hypothetical protein
VQPVSSEARRSLMSGVLPIAPIKPSRISMDLLRTAGHGHYRPAIIKGKPRSKSGLWNTSNQPAGTTIIYVDQNKART